MTVVLVVLLIVWWVACGVFAAGALYAYVQREYPRGADKNRKGDGLLSILFGVLGPAALATSLIATQFCKHGWLFPGARP